MNGHPLDRSLYFVNAGVDATLIGGLSILTAAAFWICAAAGIPTPGPGLSMALAWVVNWPHFSTSSYRLYRSKDHVLQYPMTSLAVPLLLLCSVVGGFLAPQTAGAALLKLYLLWSPYHFSGQSLGITLLYARRAGIRLEAWERTLLAGFFHAGYAALVLRQESTLSPDKLGGILYPSLGVPTWIADAADIVLAIFGVVLLLAAIRRSLVAGRFLPPILLLPALTQIVWFQAGMRLPAYNFLVPFFHSLQYLLIAWAMQLSEKKLEIGVAGSLSFVGRETSKWGLFNLLGGAALFWILPRVTSLTGIPMAISMPILFAAVQIHHFFVDGVVWKLRSPSVSSPLLVDLRDLIGGPLRPVRSADP